MVSLERLSRKWKKLLYVALTSPRTPRIFPNENGALGNKNVETGKQDYIPENVQGLNVEMVTQSRLLAKTLVLRFAANRRDYLKESRRRKLEISQICIPKGKRPGLFMG